MQTIYSTICKQKELRTWDDVLRLAARLKTLDRYFFVYEFIIQHEPEKKYGYIQRILNNPEFIQRFGIQYDEATLKKIIRIMEQSWPK